MTLDLTGYRLTFDEEFNERSISQRAGATTWGNIRAEWRADANADVGFGRSSFVDPASGYDPFSVAGGVLTITAVPDRTSAGVPGSWESGLITTQGRFAQRYGYFEMRADLSDSPGGWDAFWLMPVGDSNPDGDGDWTELDIVEHYGANNQGTYRWIHTNEEELHPNPNQTLQVYSNNPEQVTGYHTYGVKWTPTSMEFYFDGRLMGSRPTPSDFHGPMYMIANLAVQGADLPAGATSLDPMRIDYIRVFSNDPDAIAVPLDTVSAPDGRDPGLYGAVSAAGTSTGRTQHGTAGADMLRAGSGSDLIFGYEGDDTLSGGLGADVIYGNQGRDIIYGNQGDDALYGGQGDDRTYGGQGNDSVFGNLGNDIIYGNLGADLLHGGQGDDILYGGQGDDTLVGGVGNDTLVGGLGADRYVFGANSGSDLILGFSQAAGDRLSLGGQGYTLTAAADGSAALILSGGGVVTLSGVSVAAFQAQANSYLV